MGIFSWFKKIDENYKKNTKLGQWAVEKNKDSIKDMKGSLKEMGSLKEEMKEIIKGESDQEETPQTSEEDKEGK